MAFKAKTFSKPSLMTWAGNKITDHNRSDLAVSVTRIEEKTRMANGTMRKYVIADKRTFSTSWDNLPHAAGFTVDGFWAKREMESFYNLNPGPFDLVVHNGDGLAETYTVMFSKFDCTVSKRGVYDFWKVTVEMEEV